MASLEDRKSAAIERLAALPRIIVGKEKERSRRSNHTQTTRENEEARVIVLEEVVRKLEALL